MGFVRMISEHSHVVCVISFLLSAATFLLSFFNSDLFYVILHKQMKLTEGSRAVKLWSDPPVLQTMTFYVFNWTNPEEFGKKPPNLVEIGPFKYKMDQKKINIEFNDNDTLSYNVLRHCFFDAEGSVQNESYLVTTLNPIVTSAAHVMRYAGYVRQQALAIAVKTYGSKHSITKPMKDFVFDGVSDPLLTTASYFQSFTSFDIPFDKFGWFYDRNGTYYFEGTYNVGSGIKDLNDVTRIHRWDWGLRTPYFDEDCGLVKGSTGELFPQRLTKNDVLEFFLPDFCRTVKLYYKEETEVYGVAGYKFVADSRNLDNGTIDPANSCFCAGECSPVGVLNITTCRFGAPAFMSFPHFLHGDQYYLNSVKGMKPDAEKHAFYVVVEPNTGITLDVAMRLQGNVLTGPHKYISLLAKVPKIYFPLVWSEARALIPEHLALELRLGLLALNYGQIVLFCLAVTFFIPVIVTIAKMKSKSSKRKENSNVPLILEQPLLTLKASAPN